MTRKLIILLLIPLFLSCTVTKRVHRPGFHVQWKKMERTQSPTQVSSNLEKSKKRRSEKVILTQSTLESAMDSVPNESRMHTETSEINSFEDDIIYAVNEPIRSQESSLTTVFEKPSSFQQTTKLNSVRPIFWRMSPHQLRRVGLIFIVLGGMLLFASMLAAFGAFSGNGDGAWINFFLDLVDISGWFWLLFFILIIVIVSYVLVLLIVHVLGSPIVGAILGAAFLAIGIFFYALGNRREIEP